MKKIGPTVIAFLIQVFTIKISNSISLNNNMYLQLYGLT